MFPATIVRNYVMFTVNETEAVQGEMFADAAVKK